MIRVEHVNFGWLHKSPLPPACCHCLVVQSDDSVVLIDTGIGMHDVNDPQSRIGGEAIDAAGFKFLPNVTAIRQLQARDIDPSAVTDIVLTHCDPDHVGGLSDFPDARVHIAFEEKANLDDGNPRYSRYQFAHGPHWQVYKEDDSEVLGLPSRRVECTAGLDIRLVPLFGHTNGHCGVAIRNDSSWILHVGDAYYLRDELVNEHHPIDQLATLRADNDEIRRETLDRLRDLVVTAGGELTYFGYQRHHRVARKCAAAR